MVPDPVFDGGGVCHEGAVEAHEVDGIAFVIVGKATCGEDTDAWKAAAAAAEGLIFFICDGSAVAGVIEFREDAEGRVFIDLREVVPGGFGDKEDAEAAGGGQQVAVESFWCLYRGNIIIPKAEVEDGGIGQREHALVEAAEDKVVAS